MRAVDNLNIFKTILYLNTTQMISKVNLQYQEGLLYTKFKV